MNSSYLIKDDKYEDFVKTDRITDYNWNHIIKFRALNQDENYIFIKQNNTMKIYDLLQLKPLLNLHVESDIVCYEVISKSSKLVISTEKKLLLYELPFLNTILSKDFQMKLDFKLIHLVSVEKVINISHSSLSDLIVTIDKFGMIKFFDLQLNQIKSHSLPKNLDVYSYNYFHVTYDTKNICMASYSINTHCSSEFTNHYQQFTYLNNSILFLYRNVNYDSSGNTEDIPEHLISNCTGILNNQNLAYLKEMQKSIESYVESAQNSIFFILTNQHSFLITRKIVNCDEKPELIVLNYLKISEICFDKMFEIKENKVQSQNNSPYKLEIVVSNVNNKLQEEVNDQKIDNELHNNNFNYSFSLLYSHENPIHSTSNTVDIANLPSYLINYRVWNSLNNSKQTNFDEENMNFSDTDSLYFKAKIDYIMLKYKNKIFIYQIEGLTKSPLHEVSLTPYKGFYTTDSCNTLSGNLLLLKFVNTNNNKHSMLFLDENNLIRKLSIHTNWIEEEASLKIFHNIKSVMYNKRNRKLLILEYSDLKNSDGTLTTNSIITITNQKMYLTKVFYIENTRITNLKWVDYEVNTRSDWSFASLFCFSAGGRIYFYNFRHNSYNSKFNRLYLDSDKSLLYYIDFRRLSSDGVFSMSSNKISEMEKLSENEINKKNDTEIINEKDDKEKNNKKGDINEFNEVIENFYISCKADVEENTKSSIEYENSNYLNLNMFIHTVNQLTRIRLVLGISKGTAEKEIIKHKNSQTSNSPLHGKEPDRRVSSISNDYEKPDDVKYHDCDETVINSDFLFKMLKSSLQFYDIYCVESSSFLSFSSLAFYKENVYYYYVDKKYKFGVLKELLPSKKSTKETTPSISETSVNISKTRLNDKFSKFIEGDAKLIFDVSIQGELLYSGFFENETLVIITDCFIDSYSISSHFYSRMKNSFYHPENFSTNNCNLVSSIYQGNLSKSSNSYKLNNMNENVSPVKIGSKKIGNFIFLHLITPEGIKFERLPKNKSLFENFEIKFNHKLKVSNEVSQFISSQSIIVLNNQQIEFLEEIGTVMTSKELRYDFTSNTLNNKFQNLLLLNTNPNSIFELETFLDYYLDDKEELVRKLLELFYQLQNKLIDENFDISLISTKGIPNLFTLSIEDIFSLLFDNNKFLVNQNINKPNNTTNKNKLKVLLECANENETLTRRDTVVNEHLDFNRKIVDKNSDKTNNKKGLINKNSFKNTDNFEEKVLVDIFTLNDNLTLSMQTAQFYRIERNIEYLERIAEENKQERKISNEMINEKESESIMQKSQIIDTFSFDKNSRVTNLRHLVYLYETYISETTRKLDHITKYFIVKIRSKSQALESSSFRLTSSDLCWLNLINNQEYILKFLINDKKKMTFKLLETFCVPLWVKNDFVLKEFLEISGKNHYNMLLRNQLGGSSDTLVKNHAEHVGLYFYLSGKMNIVIEKFEKEAHNANVAKFLNSNFNEPKPQKQARDNAIALMTKKRYLLAILFFLLGNDIKSAIEVCMDHIKNINLAVCILRLYPSVCSYHNSNALEEEKSKVYENNFVRFGKVVRDPWLIVYSYLVRKQYDKCIDFIQKFKHYNLTESDFSNNSKIDATHHHNISHSQYNKEADDVNKIKDVEQSLEFSSDEYDVINNIIDLQLFDYKLYYFLKQVEKLYNHELSNQKKSQQSVSNTNFDDIWGGSDNEDNNKEETKEKDTLLKEIKPDYLKILELSFEDTLNKGVIFSSIISEYFLNTGELYPQNFSRTVVNKEEKYSDTNKRLFKKERGPLVLFYDLLCKRAILDTINLQTMGVNDYLQTYFITFDKIVKIFEKAGISNKQEVYSLMNISYLKLEKYNFSIFSSYKSFNILVTLEKVEREIENSALDLLYETIYFNFKENVDNNKLKDFLKNKIYPMVYFIVEVLKMQGKKTYFTSTETEPFDKNNITNSSTKFNEKENSGMKKLNQEEKDKCQIVYVIRILVKFYTILLGVAKINYRYNKFSQIHKDLATLCSQYFDIIKYPKNLFYHLENIFEYSKSLCDKEEEEIRQINDSPTMFFILLINSALVGKLKVFFETKTQDVSQEYISNYINEFKFVRRFYNLLANCNSIFTNEVERYLTKYVDQSTQSKILSELKNIYLNSSSSSSVSNRKSSSYAKFNIIKVMKIFVKENSFENFSKEYSLDTVVGKFCYKIPLLFKYEKSELTKKISKESVDITSDLFGKIGVEILKLHEDAIITGFDFNCCNTNNMAFGLNYDGLRRLNISNSLVKVKRSDDYLRINDTCSVFDEELYSTTYESEEQEVQFLNMMHNKFNEVLPVLKKVFFPNNKKYTSLFPIKHNLPLSQYNDEPTNFYISEAIAYISKNNKQTITSALRAHPLLPIYLTASDKGTFSAWSFNPAKNKPLYDFYIDKQAKDGNTKNKRMKSILFNTYGNQFLSIEEESSSLYLFDFNYTVSRNFPSITIGGAANTNTNTNNTNNSNLSNSYRLVKDACFLNSSGVLLSTFSDYNYKYCNIWDSLLPPNCCNSGELYGVGGNIISSLTNQTNFLIANSINGYVHFVDTRKMKDTFSFQAHSDEIKSMVISKSQNTLITAGKEGNVKIWDISTKNEAVLLDTITPFVKEKNFKNISILLKESNLFAAGTSSIKLLRNKIE